MAIGMKAVIRRLLPAVIADNLWQVRLELVRLSRLGFQFRSLCRASGSPAVLPWMHMAWGRDEVSRLHRCALKRMSRQYGLWGWAAWPAALAWTVRCPVQAIRALRQHGRDVRATYGIGLLRQWAELIRLGMSENVTCDTYYHQRLFLPARRAQARFYLQHEEMNAIHDMVIQRSGDTHWLDDKHRLFLACREAGLPTAPVVVVIEHGQVRWMDGRTALPPGDLFVKWTNLYCGIGAERWVHDGGRWSRQGTTLDQPQLLDHVARRARNRPALIQERLANHPDLAGFGTGGLCTLRVVTVRRRGQGPRLYKAAWRMPRGDMVVDNLAAGGIAAGLDPTTGLLTAACAKDPALGGLAAHPDTGRTIQGVSLPGWSAMIDLALQAHAQLTDLAWVGWDIAYTPRGPVVVESNRTWCVTLTQLADGAPAGLTELPQLVEVILSEPK